MYRKLVGIVLTTAAMNVNYVAALGLGEMTMHSALHQPLDAEIKLTNVGDLAADQIKIRLAGAKEFQLAGVDRAHFLTGMKFTIHTDGDGNAVIKITTHKSVKEPFLDFLVEARWPTGKVIRSYTALVDLPVFQSDTPTVVNRPQKKRTGKPKTAALNDVQNDVQSQANTETTNTFAYNSTEVVSDSVTTNAASTYRVKNNDTLWEIARKYKPEANLTVQQTMLAIQKLNPRSFTDNNINKIRAGSLLRLPSAADVTSFTTSKAIALVSEQNDQWMGRQLEATDEKVVYSKPEQEPEGHLTLTSSGSGETSGFEESQDAGQSSQVDSESLTLTQLENEELTEKVGALSSQIEKLERLITLKDEELAQLQKQLAEQNAFTEEAAIQSQPEEEVPPLAESPVTTVTTDAIEPEDKPLVPELESPQQKSFFSSIEPIHFGGIALFILAIVVALLLQRREKAEKKALAEANNFDFDDLDKPFVAPIIDDNPLAETNTQITDEVPSVEPETIEPEISEPVSPTQVETGDAVGEADIYIAYGRYEQAIELLQGAILNAPENIDFRNKLLEVYLETNDKDGFCRQLSESQELGYESVIDHAKEILSSSEHLDWIDHLAVEGKETAVALEEDLLADTSVAAETTEVAEVLESIDQTDFNVSDDSLSEDIDIKLDTLDINPDAEDIAFESLDSDEEILSTEFDIDLSEPQVVAEDPESVADLSEEDIVLPELDIALDDVSEFEKFDANSLDDKDLSNTIGIDESHDDLLKIDDLEETSYSPDNTDTSIISPSDETIDIDLSDFGLEINEIDEATDLLAVDRQQDEVLSVDVDSVELLEPNDELNDIDLDVNFDDLPSLADTVSSDTEALSDDAEAINDESLDDSIEALVKLSEDSLADNAESAFVEPEASSELLDTLDDSDLTYISSSDEVATKLDLARAYIDMGDLDGAKDMLQEVIKEGGDQQKIEASQLLESVE